MTTELTLQAILGELGLSEPEARVYLASLELGPQPASILAKRAELKRGHTYNVLSLLIKKGITQEFQKEKVRYFSSQSPRTLLSLIERRREELDAQKEKLVRALPLLERLQNPLLVQPKVRFFQGVEGIKEIYEETLEHPNRTIYAIGDFDFIFPESKSEKEHEWIWLYAKRRSEKDIKYLGIVNKSAKSDLAFKKKVAHKRQLKMLKGVYLPVEVNIYGDKVAVMSTHAEMVGVVIEDAPIAETLRNFHKAVWNFLPEYK